MNAHDVIPDSPISEVRLTLSEQRRLACRTRAESFATRVDGKYWIGLDRDARIVLGPLSCPATAMREARRLARQPGALIVVVDDLNRPLGSARCWDVPIDAHSVERVLALRAGT